LDDPTAARREWREEANDDAIRRYYDAVWVYGDPAVYDPVEEYGFPADVAAKVSFTGYLDQRWRLLASMEKGSGDVDLTGLESFLSTDRLVLCTVGGGEDGMRLAEAFAAAQLPLHTVAVLLTGPFMPREARQRLGYLAAPNQRLRVIDFLPEPEHLLRRADAVVAMGGYNTLCDVLSFEKPALIVPRVYPRAEQFIRAQRLCDLGLIDVLHPDAATPAALSAWLALPHPKPCVHSRIDFHGLDRLPQLLAKLLEPRSARVVDNAARTPQHDERDRIRGMSAV
jgi:predicted glycosyltransferase